ncbi:MAG: NYN domain-containing protein [Oscillospiraceae bacterium]|jgi:predicted RNA-binding protein with PIN domain|nr:NYN domain-containing protein [Oscillospiraceae bacterium]
MTPLLIVDGYNIIGQWEKAAKENWSFETSRDKLAHMLAEYAAFEGFEVVLVFDGLYSERLTRSCEKQGPLEIVFTRHGESADQYIERLADQTPRRRELLVATSDNVEQTVVLGRGATRIPARELIVRMSQSRKRQSGRIGDTRVKSFPVFERLPKDVRETLERMRLGKE